MAELTLDPKTTALVLIDLQNGIVGRDLVPHAAADVVERGRKMAEAFRSKGAPVVYVRVDLNDFLRLPVDEAPQIPENLPAEMSEIAAGAGLTKGDLLITKRHFGAFAQTELENELKARGVDTVVLAGVVTNIGVESTARQGTGLGFAMVVVEDACSTQSAEMHKFAFQNIFPRLSRVRATDDVLQAMA
jgi:nicotinamidase-related amidase